MTISRAMIDRMQKRLLAEMYGAAGADIRIEWQSRTGGTYDDVFDVTTGGTETDNVLSKRGIFVDGRQRNSPKLVKNDIEVNYDGIWLVETDINLKNRSNFIITQVLFDEYDSGSGTGASSTWTDTNKAWTADEWIGFWLIFSGKRMEITDNDATTLTVQLDGLTLPASDSYEIAAVKEWYPIIDAPSLEDGALFAIGERELFQAIVCTTIPSVGAE